MAKNKKIGTYIYRKGRPHPWTVQLSLGDNRLSKSFVYQDDAKKWTYEQNLKHLKSFNFKLALSTFPEMFYFFMKVEKAPNVAPATYRNYIQTAKVVKRLFPNLLLKNCSVEVMQPILDDYAKTHSAKTVSEHVKRIRASIKFAYSFNALDVDFGFRLKARGKELEEKRNKALSMSDFKKLRQELIANHDTKFKVLVLLATETGARRGELLALTKRDLLPLTHSISINKSKSPTSYSLKLKTSSSKRVVDISPMIFNIIHNLEPEPDGYIFSDDHFKQSGLLADLLTELKIPQTTFHGLRDSHASFLFASFNEDVDNAMLYVSKRLGHADLLTTQKYYIELMPEKKLVQNAQALDFLSEAL